MAIKGFAGPRVKAHSPTGRAKEAETNLRQSGILAPAGIKVAAVT